MAESIGGAQATQVRDVQDGGPQWWLDVDAAAAVVVCGGALVDEAAVVALVVVEDEVVVEGTMLVAYTDVLPPRATLTLV